MPPRKAAAVNLSFTVDSGSDDDMADELNAFPTPDSNVENTAPARKPRGRAAQTAKAAASTNATKTKTTSRGKADQDAPGAKKQSATVAKKAGARTGRKALAEREVDNGNDSEEADDLDGEDDSVVPAPPEPKTARRGRPPKAKPAQEDEVVEETAPAKKTRKTANKESAPAKAVAKPRASKRGTKADVEAEAIPETQPELEPEPMDVEESMDVEEIAETQQAPPQKPLPRRAPQTSRRAGSVSDTERDPMLRRKVGDLTKKLEAMTFKYDALKEAASAGKESSFDQLKRKTDQIAKDQDAVIKALKQQVAEMQSRTSEIAALRKDLAKAEKENARLAAENQRVNESLATAQQENKTLTTKLAAARSSVPPESKNVPGSAVKQRSTGVVLPGTAEAAKKAAFQTKKEQLYGDLTNFLVMGSEMKQNEDGDDVYDCIQTGRNGTLHFQLTVSADGSYDENEFNYNPRLDEQRDRDLIELLPDYLTEEIGFPRDQAPKFFMKIVDSMSKKIILEEDE